MNNNQYEKNHLSAEIYAKITDAEKQVEKGQVLDAEKSLKELKTKYGISS